MKRGRPLTFAGVETIDDAIAFTIRVRFAECLERQAVLWSGDDEAIHAFRLACKRLRYALERFDDRLPQLQRAAEFLAAMTDELGSAHDCAVLAGRARENGAAIIAARAQRERNSLIARARRLWGRAFRQSGALRAVADYSGFTW